MTIFFFSIIKKHTVLVTAFYVYQQLSPTIFSSSQIPNLKEMQSYNERGYQFALDTPISILSNQNTGQD